MEKATGEFIQNITEEIPGVIDTLDPYLNLIGIDDPYLQALIILLFFIFLGFVIRFVFTKFLQRLVKNTETEIDDKIIDTAKGPVLLLVIIFGLFLSGRVFVGDDEVYIKIFSTVISLLLFVILYKVIIIVVHGVRESFKENIKVFDGKLFPFFERILKILIAVLYLFLFFDIWKINLTPLIASAGVAGLAIAFAAQESISNVFGGISLFVDKAYEIGDYVIVDDKHRGEVIDIGLRSTKLKTRDDVMIVIPNSVMSNTTVVNESGIHPKLRVRIDIDVAYDTDLDKVEKILLDLAEKAEYAEKNPAPRVRFRAFKEFGVHVQLSIWVKRPALRGRYKSYIIKDIHKRFNKEKIEFALPAQDIFIRKMPKK